MNPKREIVILDSEILPSHYLFSAKRLTDGKVIDLWGHRPDDMDRLGGLLRSPSITWVGFNNDGFDMPLAIAAAGGASVRELKSMADDIINNRKPPWATYRDYALAKPKNIDSIDLIEVAPGVMISLKLYAGRMGSPRMRDMPYEHDDLITDEEAQNVLLPYCHNDLDETERLYRRLEDAIQLREKMGEKYGLDLRSKSDAQMAETIIVSELGLARKPKPDVPQSVRYKAPAFIQPRSGVLQDVLSRVENHTFKVSQMSGAVELPEFLAGTPIIIGNFSFQMGIGGLHSTFDKCVCYKATDDFVIRDADVGAFYPMILLNAGFVPRGLGEPFIKLYRKFVMDRLAAKNLAASLKKIQNRTPEQEQQYLAAKTLNEGGKIMINGTFGKLGSWFSKIYSPDLMLAITLTGQFYLLTLIEHLVALGVRILSANTDGVTFGGTPAQVEEATKLIEIYAWTTNFEFEFVDYLKLAMKDVNNYVAVKTDGSTKAKGLYALSGLMKNPTNEVCTIAAQAYLSKGTPIEETICNHLTIENFPDFLQCRNVKGGAVFYREMVLVDDWVQVGEKQWQRPGQSLKPVSRVSRPKPVEVGQTPEFIGRVARWYYSTSHEHAHGLHYKSNGNLVPKSSGGRVCLDLPTTLPTDIDLKAYEEETRQHLANMGLAV